MVYNFSETQKKNIIDNFGVGFYEKILQYLEIYSEKWKLKIISLVDYFSVNCIFICHSEYFGDAVLKICRIEEEFSNEISVLKEYEGTKFCKIYDYDMKNGIILEECIKPGSQLKEEKSFDKRLDVFMTLFNGLHREPAAKHKYPSYMDWVSKITGYMSGREEYRELYSYMREAENICKEIFEKYPERMLLHGDFHYDNILLGEAGEYRIIDPKGVTGPVIFDLPRYIINEYGDERNGQSFKEKCSFVQSMTEYFSKKTNIPAYDIKKVSFIEMAMTNCWNVESGEIPEIGDVIFAEKAIKYVYILNK